MVFEGPEQFTDGGCVTVQAGCECRTHPNCRRLISEELNRRIAEVAERQHVGGAFIHILCRVRNVSNRDWTSFTNRFRDSTFVKVTAPLRRMHEREDSRCPVLEA